MTIKDLTNIKGIKRNIAKKIKKEITNLPEKTDVYYSPEFLNSKEQVDTEEEWETFDEKKVPKKAKKEIKGFKHKGYKLYEKKIKTKSGKKRTVRLFSKTKPKGTKPIKLPKGFKVLINKKTGIPYLKKKK